MQVSTKSNGWPRSFLALIAITLAFASISNAYAARADLPTANEVALGAATQWDGEYRISTLNKRILIQRGRAVVLEGWKHLFIWDIVPGMVVVRDIRQVDNSNMVGHDLGLNGEWRARYNPPKGSFNVVVAGPMGDYRYELIPANGADDRDSGGYTEADPVELRVKARRIGNATPAVATKCPGKQSYLSRGSCWVCPNGYKRGKVTREMHQPDACVKRKSWGKGPFTKATRLKSARARCPAGQFHIAEKGINGCYSCPAQYVRDTSTRNSAMCKLRQG